MTKIFYTTWLCVWLVGGCCALAQAQIPEATNVDSIAVDILEEVEVPENAVEVPEDAAEVPEDFDPNDIEFVPPPPPPMDVNGSSSAYSVLTFYVRPQMLLHRHPQLTGGFELRPTKRFGLLAEYGHGLNYTVFSPEKFAAQTHYKVRGALHFYKKKGASRRFESYRGVDFFYNPLEFTADRHTLQVRTDEGRRWYRLENARISYPTMAIGYVSGSSIKLKRLNIFIESSTGLRFFDTVVLSATKNELLDGKPSLGLFNRPLYGNGAIRFYYSIRVNFGYSVWQKRVGSQNSNSEVNPSDGPILRSL